MKTAKEILLEESKSDPNFGLLAGTMPVIERAMDKYAKQESLSFASFLTHYVEEQDSPVVVYDEEIYEIYKNKKQKE